MTIDVNEYILRLDITVDNVHVMTVLKSKKQLCKVKFGLLFCKFLNFAKMKEHFSTSAEIHDKEEFSFRLKRPV